jgi:hypothetical protein
VGADLGHGAVLGVPEAADQRDDIEPEFVVREGEPPSASGRKGRLWAGQPALRHRRMVRLRRVTPDSVVMVRRLV